MSTNLYWEPLTKRGSGLPNALKFILRDAWGWPVNRTVTHADEGYFRGLRDAKIEGAAEILDLLENHGEIHLEER